MNNITCQQPYPRLLLMQLIVPLKELIIAVPKCRLLHLNLKLCPPLIDQVVNRPSKKEIEQWVIFVGSVVQNDGETI